MTPSRTHPAHDADAAPDTDADAKQAATESPVPPANVAAARTVTDPAQLAAMGTTAEGTAEFKPVTVRASVGVVGLMPGQVATVPHTEVVDAAILAEFLEVVE